MIVQMIGSYFFIKMLLMNVHKLLTNFKIYRFKLQ